jgi:hypothetical protein
MQAPNVVAVDWLLGRLRPTLEKVAAWQGVTARSGASLQRASGARLTEAR